jgi:hypothetical protein
MLTAHTCHNWPKKGRIKGSMSGNERRRKSVKAGPSLSLSEYLRRDLP